MTHYCPAKDLISCRNFLINLINHISSCDMTEYYMSLTLTLLSGEATGPVSPGCEKDIAPTQKVEQGSGEAAKVKVVPTCRSVSRTFERDKCLYIFCSYM